MTNKLVVRSYHQIQQHFSLNRIRMFHANYAECQKYDSACLQPIVLPFIATAKAESYHSQLLRISQKHQSSHPVFTVEAIFSGMQFWFKIKQTFTFCREKHWLPRDAGAVANHILVRNADKFTPAADLLQSLVTEIVRTAGKFLPNYSLEI